MSHVDQRIAAVAHLSIGFGIVVGVGFLLGLAINLVIWLRSRRSTFVELHAEQAGAYQLIVLLTNLLIAAIWIGVVVMEMGDPDFWSFNMTPRHVLTGLWCALIPLQLAWYFGTIVYGLYAGVLVAAGRDFTYPIIGRRIRQRLAARDR
jgi:uncharacterized Tic20 family protein